MKILLISISLLLFITSYSFAENPFPYPKQWTFSGQPNLSGNEDFSVVDVIQNSNGNYIILSQIYDNSFTVRIGFNICEYNSNIGSFTMNLSFYASDFSFETLSASSICSQADNSGYVVVGNYYQITSPPNPSDTNSIVFFLRNNLSVENIYMWDLTGMGAYEHLIDVICTNDNKYVAVGGCFSPQRYHGCILKFDKNDTENPIKWFLMPETAIEFWDYLTEVVETPDGDYGMTGMCQRYSNYYRSFYLVSSEGDLIYEEKALLGNHVYTNSHDLIYRGDNEFVISGRVLSSGFITGFQVEGIPVDPWILRTNSSMCVDLGEIKSLIKIDNNGNYITGFLHGGCSDNAELRKCDSLHFFEEVHFGQLFWYSSNHIPFNHCDNSWIIKLINTNDGGFLVAGGGFIDDNRYIVLSKYSVPSFKETLNEILDEKENFVIQNNISNNINIENLIILGSSTLIKYQITNTTNIEISVYNMIGQKVKTLVNNVNDIGSYELTWDWTDNNGFDVSNGTYFIIIKTDNYQETKGLRVIR